MAGRQISVSTRTYTCSVAVLLYLACGIARRPPAPLSVALKRVIETQEKTLERRDTLTQPTAEFFDEPPYVALLSRGADLSSIYQGSLMFKEVVRVGAEPMSAAQFRHGPVEIINPSHRYVVVARQGARGHTTRTGRLLIGLAEEIRAHGGRVLLFADLPFPNTPNVRLISVDPLPFGLGTLVDSLHIQLLTHELAQRAGLEPGKFWIATDVTRVE
jgi:glucosamine--fructose-6-phosphate aminotransferase (isomerizing)